MSFDQHSSKYEECGAIIILEFLTEDRFIKLGEVSIDLAEVHNHHQNGEVIQYPVQKCFDRNAKIGLAVFLSQICDI
jgi:hypothetical protein